jgi:ADP-heptose:LPS heptosyltransferase
MGIGDLIMFMPVINALISKRFNITAKCTRQINLSILHVIYPDIDIYNKKKSNNFGICILNFQTTFRGNILTVMRERIPIRIGHVWHRNKYSKLFNYPVIFNQFDKEYIVNDCLIHHLFTWGELYLESFLTIKPNLKLPDKYTVLQPYSATDSRKNCDDIFDFLQTSDKLVVLVGSKHEAHFKVHYKHLLDFRGELNIFETAYLIKNAETFYSLESGLAHVAHAVGQMNTIVYHNDELSKSINYRTFYPEFTYIKAKRPIAQAFTF